MPQVFGKVKGAPPPPAAAGAAGLPPAGPGGYELRVTTGSKAGAGINETLHVALRGAGGAEGAVAVPHDPGPLQPLRFQRGSTDVVYLDAGRDLGEVQSVHLWHTGKVRGGVRW